MQGLAVVAEGRTEHGPHEPCCESGCGRNDATIRSGRQVGYCMNDAQTFFEDVLRRASRKDKKGPFDLRQHQALAEIYAEAILGFFAYRPGRA